MKYFANKRRFAIGSAVSLGLLTVGLLVIALGYSSWKERRLVVLAERFLEEGDRAGAALMAQAALDVEPESVQAQRILVEAYWTENDSRVLDALAEDPEAALERTLKAIELGKLGPARASHSTLEPGISVDPVSYHEMGVVLYGDDPTRVYEHTSSLADLEPDRPERLLPLATLCLQQGIALPDAHREGLVNLSESYGKPMSAEAAAVRWLLCVRLESESGSLSGMGRLQATACLIRQMESSRELPNVYLRTLEVSLVLESVEAPLFVDALKGLCTRGQSANMSSRLAECLSRMGAVEELVAWFEASPEAFPILAIAGTKSAYGRLLAADASAQQGRWDLVASAVFGSELPSGKWGDLEFLRHFYQGRAMQFGHFEPGAKFSEVEKSLRIRASLEAANQKGQSFWQQAVLERMQSRYPAPAGGDASFELQVTATLSD